ncbi:MAG: LamG-like jellyroll fold domain-containing protein, partial [Planctomycetota bacterium]
MTGLRRSGRSGVPLQSAVEITDGSWHRIGFVWDGLYRVIYVDDIPVAEDTQTGLESSVGGLKIGCGIDPAAGTFWSGLIDEVRIYNRAVSP